jgi:hypothetical protein
MRRIASCQRYAQRLKNILQVIGQRVGRRSSEEKADRPLRLPFQNERSGIARIAEGLVVETNGTCLP